MKSLNIVRLKGKNVDLCVVRQDEEAIIKYTEWMNDEEINMYIDRNNRNATYLLEKEWCEKKKEETAFNIVAKDGELIGNCEVKMEGRNAELGICIGEKSGRDKGYGTEVMRMMIRFAFEELNAHRCHLTLNGDNDRAYKCYIKVGMRDCGREHETDFYHGKWCDCIHMEMLEDEYWKKKGPQNIC